MKKDLVNYMRLNYTEDLDYLKNQINTEYINSYKDNKTDADLLVFYKDDTAYFITKGTEKNFKDIIFNFMICPITIEKGKKVHHGFYSRYIALQRHFLDEYIRAYKKGIRKFHFLGDSAGGSVISIAYYYFKFMNVFKDIEAKCLCVSTLAFANKKFMKCISDVEYFINDSDPIRFIPLWLLGYTLNKKVTILKTDKFFNIYSHSNESYIESIE